MPVSEEMRAVEREIDQAIESLPVWAVRRETLLLMILDFYRIEMIEVSMRLMHGRLFNNVDSIRIGLLKEHYLHSGVLQALKWAMEFAGQDGRGPRPEAEDIGQLVELGKLYEMLVDGLKQALHDRVAIHVNRESRTITVYEGGDLTGADNQLIEHQVETLPYHSHTSFVEDGDELTARWTAGEYRELMERLAGMARLMETSQGVSTFPGKEAADDLPSIIEIPSLPEERQCAVMDDLTLSPEKVQGRGKWLLTSWLDIPLVQVGAQRFAATNVLKAMAGRGRDDHMLRVAARVDPRQYSNVSGLREERMIHLCTKALTARGWDVSPHYELTDPLRELDIYATRGNEKLVLQLKSTLRPETPWEVLKRNDDLLAGIEHTSEACARLAEGTVGIVITDGYRGDYYTWARALSLSVMTGTVRDIDDIAESPLVALELLKLRAGFSSQAEAQPFPDRDFQLFGWTFRLTDSAEP